jgi:hypothetical protein
MQRVALSFHGATAGSGLEDSDLQLAQDITVLVITHLPKTVCFECTSIACSVGDVNHHAGLALGYSYRSASAGRMRAADQEGYKVATKEIPIATKATISPSMARGAKGT